MKTQLESLEELVGTDLQIVETTSGWNGYPSQLQHAIVGFNTFEEAEVFAEEHSMELIHLKKRDGWDLWERGNTAWNAYDMMPNYDNDNNTVMYNYQEDITEEVKDYISGLDEFEEIAKAVETYKEINEKIEDLEEDEILLVHNGSLEVIKKEAMSYCEDVYHYTIAAI